MKDMKFESILLTTKQVMNDEIQVICPFDNAGDEGHDVLVIGLYDKADDGGYEIQVISPFANASDEGYEVLVSCHYDKAGDEIYDIEVICLYADEVDEGYEVLVNYCPYDKPSDEGKRISTHLSLRQTRRLRI